MFQDSVRLPRPADAGRHDPARAAGHPAASAHRSSGSRIAAMLDEVGLPRAAVERYPHEFSGGQRQRIGLARALILRPAARSWPTSRCPRWTCRSGADPQPDAATCRRDLGLTYLFISHDLAVVRYMSETGSASCTWASWSRSARPTTSTAGPAHPYTAGLIATIPVPDPRAAQSREDRAQVARRAAVAVNPPSGCRFRTRCPLAQDSAPPRSRRCARSAPATWPPATSRCRRRRRRHAGHRRHDDRRPPRPAPPQALAARYRRRQRDLPLCPLR